MASRPVPVGRPVLSARISPWSTFLLCCFAVICGFRFFLVERFGTPVAWGDDIDGIGFRILRPLNNGTFTLSSLFAAHNGDHVIAATRLWEIFWYHINGDWDPKLMMMVKTPVYAAAATLFIHIFVGGLERRRFIAAAVLTVLFAFPFNYHNLLWAFQSQFDFFLLSAALGWCALLSGRPVLALICALLAPFTLGAGPVLAVSYLPFFFAAAWNRTWSVRRAVLFTVIALGIIGFGATLATGEHLPRTGTLAGKAATLLRLYAWPYSNVLSAIERLPESSSLIPAPLLNFPEAERSWMRILAEQIHRHPSIIVSVHFVIAVFFAAPLTVVAALVARRRISLSAALGPLNLGVFAGCMLAATVIARTDLVRPTIAVRFLDHVMLAGFASIAACFILVTLNRRWRPWLAGWGLVLGAGYLVTVGATLSQMVNRRSPEASLELLQRYYVANDHTVLRENDAFKMFIVSDDPTGFLTMLDDPDLRPVLPRAITAPNSARGWAAASASVIGRWGWLIVFLGAVGGIMTAFRARRSQVPDAAVVVPGAPA